MDPLSIAASAAGFASLAGALIQNVGQLIASINYVDATVEEFRTITQSLQTALHNIAMTFKERTAQQEFERKHWQDIQNVLNSCSVCIYRLDSQLPKPGDGEGSSKGTYEKLKFLLKTEVVVSLRAQMALYTQVLQLSLTTISLASQRRSQESQNRIESQVKRLGEEIRAALDQLRQQQRANLVVADHADNAERTELSRNHMATSRNIEEWAESAVIVARAMTVYEPDEISVADRETDSWAARIRTWNRESIHSAHSPTNAQNREPSNFDPDPELNDCLDAATMLEQVGEFQRAVELQMNADIYDRAERDQREAIKLMDRMEKTHGIPFEKRADFEETLATILCKRDTEEGRLDAQKILERLLEQEQAGGSRKWRLYHSLAEVYALKGDKEQAIKFATRALNGRQQLPDTAFVPESAELLVKIYQQFNEHNLVGPVRKLALSGASTLPPPSQSASSETSEDLNIHRWLKKHGFYNDNVQNPYDARHPEKGQTPLQLAISTEEVKVVTFLLERGISPGSSAPDSEAPLLLAATTKNKKIVSLLLSHGADVSVVDTLGNNALHRVQSSSGGLRVAQLLLAHSAAPGVDQRNNLGKTPLHLSAGFGNADMVGYLLEQHAHVDAKDLAGHTPLHVAIYERRVEIVSRLLEAGASMRVRDLAGLDAIAMTKRLNPGSLKIMTLLEDERRIQEKRKQDQTGGSDGQSRRTTATSSLGEGGFKRPDSLRNGSSWSRILAFKPHHRGLGHNRATG
jgi:tetratricopeptide (TPR) repeat protein